MRNFITFSAAMCIALMFSVPFDGCKWTKTTSAEKLLDDANEAAKEGNYGQAIERFTKAIESGKLSHEDLAYAYCGRGDARKWFSENDLAIADFKRAIEIAPQNTMPYICRAEFWLGTGDYDQAVADYNKALEIQPKDETTYFMRGCIWNLKGEFDKAILDFDRAIETESIQLKQMAYHQRGLSLYFQLKFREAIIDFQRANENNPTKNYYYLFILLAARRGAKEDYPRYLNEFRQLANAPKVYQLIKVISKYYLGMDNVKQEDVLSEAQKGKGIQGLVGLCQAYYFIGEQKLWEGNRQEAEEFFRRSIQTNIRCAPEYQSSKVMLKLMEEGKL